MPWPRTLATLQILQEFSFLIGQRFFISLATQGEQFPELGIFSVLVDFAALPPTPLSIYHMEVVAYDTRLDSEELIFF